MKYHVSIHRLRCSACSYPKQQTSAFNSWTQYAFVNITQTWSNYVKGGGIKAVFGEWTLAGVHISAAAAAAAAAAAVREQPAGHGVRVRLGVKLMGFVSWSLTVHHAHYKTSVVITSLRQRSTSVVS